MSHPLVGAALDRIRKASQRPAGLIAPPGAVSLAVGDPDFTTPEVIVEAAVDALKRGYTHYADWNGDPELRHRIASLENDRSGSDYRFGEAVVGHGANGVLMAAILAAVGPRDRVIIPEPTYSLYGDLVAMAGGTAEFVPLAEDLHLDLDRIARALPGARMLVLCNPGNPTGAVFSRVELEAVARLAVEHDVLVIVDEAYADLVYSGDAFPRAASIPSWRDLLITCQTLSKTYAMTGWRLGYALAPEWLADGMRQIHATSIGAVNTVVQRAALVALDAGPDLATPMMSEYKRRRALMLERISEIPGLTAHEPEGAFYIFAKYVDEIDSVSLSRRLLEGGVAVRPGREYGPSGERHVRLSFATDLESIAEGMSRIARVFDELRSEAPTASGVGNRS